MSASAPDLARQLERLEALIREMEHGAETPVRARAREIVRAVLDLHAGGLSAMMDLARASDAALADRLARDPRVAGLLLLHGLHPNDLETRVRGAVDALAPMLQGQGAALALHSTADGIVRLRLERAIGRAGLPADALRLRVEEAIIAAAPDVTGLEIDGPDGADIAAFVPVDQVRMRASR
jgi:hypothetical protein